MKSVTVEKYHLKYSRSFENCDRFRDIAVEPVRAVGGAAGAAGHRRAATAGGRAGAAATTRAAPMAR